MKTDVINPNSSSFQSQEAHEVGGTKKVFTYSGSTAEALLDSATTAYGDNDIVAYAGALDVSVPDGYHSASKVLVEKITWNCSVAAGATMVGSIAAGTSANEALNGAVTSAVELFGAGATYRNANLAADLSITEVDVDFNTAGIMYAQPLIILPVATNYIYVRTTTAINHVSNFDAGRYQLQVEYTVL